MKLPKEETNHKDLNWLRDQDIKTKMEILGYYSKTMTILTNEILGSVVTQLAGEKYSRDKPHNGRYSRWGYNPGSIHSDIGKIPIMVPRLYDNQEDKNKTLETYQKLHSKEHVENDILPAILGGLSMGKYREVVDKFAEGFGLSQSSVSEKFKEEAARKLEYFESRRLDKYNFVSLFIDGKNIGGEQIIIVLGVTLDGRKIPVSFIQSYSENSRAIGQMLEKLKERGLEYSKGLLCVVDGSKGIIKALKDKFGHKAVIQRCQYHKRDNILSYLNQADQDKFKRKISIAYSMEKYEEAKARLYEIMEELEEKNLAAVNSIKEGLEETLTLHKLGVNVTFDRTFSTTNPIENVNSQIQNYTQKVKHWQNSKMRYRWIASALLECENNMRRVNNYRKLDILQERVEKLVKERESNNT